MMFMGCHNRYAEMLLKVRAQLFTWCHIGYAEMLLKVRTKGRAISCTQKCQYEVALPNQSQGAMEYTQKCRKLLAPTSFIWCQANGAEMPWTTRAKGRVTLPVQKCQAVRTLPINYRGPNISRRNAPMASPPPNLGQCRPAAMPKSGRPNNTDQRPPPFRRNAIALAPRN